MIFDIEFYTTNHLSTDQCINNLAQFAYIVPIPAANTIMNLLLVIQITSSPIIVIYKVYALLCCILN